MNKIILPSMLLLLLMAGLVNAALTPDESALIDRALALYADMHAGRYEIKILSTTLSNGYTVAKTEIKAAGLTFPGTLSIKMPPALAALPRHRVAMLAGGLFGAEYSLRLFGPLWIQAGAGWADTVRLWGGVGLSW